MALLKQKKLQNFDISKVSIINYFQKSIYKLPNMEVTCELVRGPVFLAGEEVECIITFCNNDDEEDAMHNDSGKLDSLTGSGTES